MRGKVSPRKRLENPPRPRGDFLQAHNVIETIATLIATFVATLSLLSRFPQKSRSHLPVVKRSHPDPCSATPEIDGFRWFRYATARMTQEEHSFTLLFEPAEEGGYVVTCPALPGLVTEGDTLEQAREMAKDAIRGYLESLRKDGLPIPQVKKLPLDLTRQQFLELL